MSASSRRAAGISGWLAACAISVVYLAGRYDISVQERPRDTQDAAVAANMDLAPAGNEPVAAKLHEILLAEARAASGPELLVVDRRIAAAEQEFPSDYRFTYQRAQLAVYGRAEHPEAFHHLKRAADKAIRTERAEEMLERLEADGAPGGPLRKLAVGHREWGVIQEALEHREMDPLWQLKTSARHHAAAHTEASPPPTEPHREDPLSARTTAFALLESGKPCQALVALQRMRHDPEAAELYHSAREMCLR